VRLYCILLLQETKVFVNLALKIQCHVVKNTLLQTAFSAILPTGRLERNICLQVYFSGVSIKRVQTTRRIFCLLKFRMEQN